MAFYRDYTRLHGDYYVEITCGEFRDIAGFGYSTPLMEIPLEKNVENAMHTRFCMDAVCASVFGRGSLNPKPVY